MKVYHYFFLYLYNNVQFTTIAEEIYLERRLNKKTLTNTSTNTYNLTLVYTDRFMYDVFL